MSFEIPAIPAGAQLGGEGTAANQAPTVPAIPQTQAPQVPQVPVIPTSPAGANVPPVPVRDPATGQWVLPSAQAEAAPLSTPLLQKPVPPTAVPNADNPVTVEVETKAPDVSVGATYLETSVNHFATEVGTTAEAIMGSIDKALEYGDATLIDVSKLGTLTPEQSARATQLATMVLQHTQQEIVNVKNTVADVAGGADKWGIAIDAFNASATPEAKQYVAYLVDVAGTPKEAAEYVVKYINESGLVTQVKQAPVQGGTGAPVVAGLSVQEYKNGIHEIELLRNARQITQSDYDVRMEDLDYRRSVGRKAGR